MGRDPQRPAHVSANPEEGPARREETSLAAGGAARGAGALKEIKIRFNSKVK